MNFWQSLDKDQKQKVSLGAMMLIFVLYGYWSLIYSPLVAKEGGLRIDDTKLDADSKQADTDILKARNRKADADKADATLASIIGAMPEGEPVSWFPPRMGAFFKRQLPTAPASITMRSEQVSGEKGTEDLRLFIWDVKLDQVDFIPLGIAIAGLENEEPLLQITGITITAQIDNKAQQPVILSLQTFNRK